MPLTSSKTLLGNIQEFPHKPLKGFALMGAFGIQREVSASVFLYGKLNAGIIDRDIDRVVNLAGPFVGLSTPVSGRSRTTFVGAVGGLGFKGLPNPLGGFRGEPFGRSAELVVGGGIGYGRTVASGAGFRQIGSGMVYFGEVAYRMQVTNVIMLSPATTVIGGLPGSGSVRPTTTVIGSVKALLRF
jgi:hypothetical protein